MQDEPAAETQEGIHHNINVEERMPNMSSFEKQMINRMDTFADNQRNLYEMCESRFTNMDTRFSTLDEQIEEVQRQIMELQFQREDSPFFSLTIFFMLFLILPFVYLMRQIRGEVLLGSCNVLNCVYCF